MSSGLASCVFQEFAIICAVSQVTKYEFSPVSSGRYHNIQGKFIENTLVVPKISIGLRSWCQDIEVAWLNIYSTRLKITVTRTAHRTELFILYRSHVDRYRSKKKTFTLRQDIIRVKISYFFKKFM